MYKQVRCCALAVPCIWLLPSSDTSRVLKSQCVTVSSISECVVLCREQSSTSDLHASEDLPNEESDLICCSRVSWKANKLERVLVGFSRLSNTSI